jgi:origin recognition complex subunit 4
MDDSPRSSKRRKLDTPKSVVSSPLTKSSAKRASGRLSKRTVSDANGAVDEPTPKRRGRPPKSAANGTPAKRVAADDIDIYDDIEGAMGIKSSVQKPRRRAQMASKEDTADDTDELQQVAATPTRGKGQLAKNAESAGRSASRTLVNGHKHGSDTEADVQDELVVEAATPSRRKKATGTPASKTRIAPTPRSSGRRRKSSPVAEDTDEEGEPWANINRATPKTRSARKSAASARKHNAAEEPGEPAIPTSLRSFKRRKGVEGRTTISETEDEVVVRPPPSSRKLTAAARRKVNRTDNISSRDESSEEDSHAGPQDDDDMDVDGNSVLESVLDPTEPSPFNKPTSAQKEKATPSLIYGNLPAGQELDLLKTIVLERITGKRPSPLVGLEEEYKTVYQLIEHTITAGEGNSMLLIGARGSGKTALVNKVLSEVSKENGGEYHVVRLNGFIHTDDKIALREIWRQLGKEMDIEEDGSGPGKNYADTLTTLLALLSHPSEQTGELTDLVAKAVIFIMDEFDLFAQHPRQTLLYNLFDIAQSRKAPIAVLGLTTRIDVTNSLEKRVKSRFSHRYLHLSLAKTFTAFQEISKACLTVQPEYLTVEERSILENGTKSRPAKKREKEAKQDVLTEWNANINVS